MTRTWFITGANRGLGRAFTEAALGAGDRVVATARDPRAMAELNSGPSGDRLLTLPLDVRDRAAAAAVAHEAVERTGGIDVVVNNAGFGLVGAVEELSEEQWREQMEVNFFGALWVSQAFAPHLRARGRGHIVQISTVGAVGAMPLFGAYNASKWALEGFSAALAEELRPFGVHVTLAQLGGFDTDWAKSSMRFGSALPAYAGFRENILGMPDYPDPSMFATETTTGTGTGADSTGEHPAGAPAEGAGPAGADAGPSARTPGDEAGADEAGADEAGADEEGADEEGADEADAWADAPPEVAARALLALVDEPNPPLRKVIGPSAHQMVTLALEARRADYLGDPAFVWPA